MRTRYVLGQALLLWIACLVACHRVAGYPALDSELSSVDVSASESEADALERFAVELEGLRQKLRIPGLSAAIVRDQELVWAQGFGYADVTRQVQAGPHTPFHLASVTKPVAATLLMQLVEDGLVDLEDPVSDYGIHLESQGTIRVWHLLTHTSEGVPGTYHIYSGDRFAYLGQVIAAASGQSFGRLLTERVLTPLGMIDTAPNPLWTWEGLEGFFAALGFAGDDRGFARVYRQLARPYQLDASYDNVAGSYALLFNPAAGLLSSAADVAKFDIALDQGRLVGSQTRERMFTPAIANSGKELVYGLGWYAQSYGGTRLIWHAGGWPPSASALLLKAPDEDLTFIVLANNYNLTRPYPMGSGDVLYSTPALAFYKRFLFPRQFGKVVPDVNWERDVADLMDELARVTDQDVRDVLERELLSYRMLYASVGETELAGRLWTVHTQAFPRSALGDLPAASSVNLSAPRPWPRSITPDGVVVICWLLLVWVVLAAVGMLAYILNYARSAVLPGPFRLAWLLVLVLFGPLGFLAYWISDGRAGRAPGQQVAMGTWRRALGPALYGVMGNVVGIVPTILVYYYLMPARPAGPVALLTAFLIGWLVFRASLRARVRGDGYWVALRRTALPELASTIAVVAGVTPVLLVLTERVLRDVSPDNPLYWAAVLGAALVGALVVYPLNVWWVHRGVSVWPVSRGAERLQ